MFKYLNKNIENQNLNLLSKDLEKLQVGDIVKVQICNKIIPYKIVDIQIVSKENIMFIKSYEKDILTLIKDYPFNYIESAPMRWVIKAIIKR